MNKLNNQRIRGTLVTDFEIWLKKNRTKLPREFYVVDKTRMRASYMFKDVPHISFSLNQNGMFDIVVTYRRKCIDLLGDFDVIMARSSAGTYFCSWCKDEGNAFYSMHRMGLLERHCFLPFLEWCNEHIREDRFLVMTDTGGCSTARICSEENLKLIQRKKDDTLFVIKRLFGPGLYKPKKPVEDEK